MKGIVGAICGDIIGSTREFNSIKTKEISIYKEKVNSDAQVIKNLKSSRKKIIGGSLVGGIVLFIIGLIL